MKRVMEQIEAMSPEHREEAMLAWIGFALAVMPPRQIRRLRTKYVIIFGPRADVIDLIDGHLALREINELPDETA